MNSYTPHPASFRDPAGFIFRADGKIYRQVNLVYAAQYERLMESGLYAQLTSEGLLIPHREIPANLMGSQHWYKTLEPITVNTISYPYEWSAVQLRDAALLTLKVLRTAIRFGMVLKDANPYNVQFHQGKPVFIDTLSFEPYDASKPWVAYRQFCQCFLFPVYLEHYLRLDLQRLLTTWIDGIPVAVTARLLPARSRFSLGVWLHVYLQNMVRQQAHNSSSQPFSQQKLLNLVTHLESIIQKLPHRSKQHSTWSNYYTDTILGQEYLQAKDQLFRSFLDKLQPASALDLGANDGYFSRIMAQRGIPVIAADSDSRCIENLYLSARKDGLTNILPLLLDISNPTPALGFRNEERASFQQRVSPDLVVALALIHHLCIGKNIPLPALAEYFHSIAPQLIIEFVPKEDEKVKQMLSSRQDVFAGYHEPYFEDVFSAYFTIREKSSIPGSTRILYLMKRKDTL
ncbi:MAG: class I SAM-dependent methyltransferase [Candidatus Pseudobacter hemicellulosilyticus]|uniref:Class I SAM-dependent methyltransferase n=1 Tax=Candidatus Pseudobacter hemicellulosilyticus TaxID=3121375 RepID=A0AAJ5WVZ6_9BACT|nr:MAG: class I SAM-dependent methyltransferase [Pseudobacter sp.]